MKLHSNNKKKKTAPASFLVFHIYSDYNLMNNPCPPKCKTFLLALP